MEDGEVCLDERGGGGGAEAWEAKRGLGRFRNWLFREFFPGKEDSLGFYSLSLFPNDPGWNEWRYKLVLLR